MRANFEEYKCASEKKIVDLFSFNFYTFWTI
jgi:hypothetical protein